jgi:RNA polymerase sigma factor (sigma-70 family)
MTKGVEAKLWQDAAWLRRLARALVRDASLAEDLVQEVWLTALRVQPRFEGSARPWLAKVARNLVRSEVRSARSHDRWRRLSADADTLPSPEALITEHEGLKILGRLVSDLDEPYRSTVVLCYGEGLTPTQVARRLGLAPGTVRWRLKHGLDRLRAGLEGERATRGRARALALVGGGPSKAPAVRAWGGRQLAVRMALVAAGAALLGLTAALVAHPGAGPPRPAAASIVRREPAAAIAPRFRRRPRFDTGPGEALPAWVAQPGVAARRVAGRVLAGAAPAAGARVVLGHQLARYGALAPLETVSDRDGRFDFGPQIATAYTVVAQAPGRALAAIRVDLRRPDAHLATDAIELVLGSCDDGLHGRIVDPGGLPVAGARVLASGLVGVTAGADGSYRLCVARGKLDTRVEASGYGTILIKADVVGHLRRDVVLVPHASVGGRVLDEDGAPVATAHVRAWRPDPGPRERFVGPASALTDAEGRFQLGGLEPGRWLFAADGATVASGTAVPRTLAAGWSEQPIALSVRRAVQVAGRVLEQGRPVVAGASISFVAASGGGPSDSARTQDDGRFVIGRVPPGELRAIVRGYRVLGPALIDPSAQQSLEISVERIPDGFPTPGRRSRSVPE